MITLQIQNSSGDWIDIKPFVKSGGLQISRNDVDASGSGRSLLNGEMLRKRVAIKKRIDITCIPLKTNEVTPILQLIEPEFVMVRYTDPFIGSVVDRPFYSNNVPVMHTLTKDDTEYWSGFQFPLIER